MIKMSEKKTNHSILIGLLSESPIPVETALFALRKSIDNDILEDSDIMIVYARELDAETVNLEKKDREPSRIAGKIKDIASRSPGVLGDLFALLKGRSWKEIYIGFAGTVLICVLLYKWFIRLITGTFI